MGKKFHVSTNGIPAVCRAEIRCCPRGGASYHKSTYKECMELADRINEETVVAKKAIGNKINKLTDVFGKSRPLESQLKSTKKIIEDYEGKIWKEAYRQHKLEEPFDGYTESTFRKDFLATDETYQSAIKRLDKLNYNKSIYIQERLDSVNLVKELRPYIRGLSFSNASGSSYFVFGTKDKDEVLTLLKQNNIIIKRDSIKEKDKVFAVRLADHKKHRTKFNRTNAQVEAGFDKDYKKLKNKEMKNALKDLEKQQKYIAKLVGELNAFKRIK